MAVTVKGAATTTIDTDGGATSDVSRPTAGTPTAGDAYVIVAQSYGTGSTPGAHSATGFVVLGTVTATIEGDVRIRVSILARAHDGSEGASFTVATASGSEYTYLIAFGVAGANLTGTSLANFLDTAAATANSNSFATPAVTTVTTNALAVTVGGGYEFTTVPTGWATALAILDGGFIAATTRAMTAPGSTGTATWGNGGGDLQVARITVAIRSALAVVLPEIASASLLFAPTVSNAASSQSVTLSAIASTTSLAAPTVTRGAVAITLPHIASTVTLHAPTVTAPAPTPEAPDLTVVNDTTLNVDWTLTIADQVDLRWRRTDITPPSLTTQSSAPWHLDRIDDRNQDDDGTYTYRYTGDGVTVYIVDSGVRRTHNEFDGRVSATGFVADGAWGTPFVDEVPHGTPCMSLAIGETFGVAKGATGVSVKVSGEYLGDFLTDYDTDPSDGTEGLRTVDYIAALEWILANHPAGTPGVVTDSTTARSYDALGNPDPHADPTAAAALEQAVQDLIDAGLTYVCWGGNYDEPPHWVPAIMGDTITVGGIDDDDHRFIVTPGVYASGVGAFIDIFGPADPTAAAGPASDSATVDPGAGTSSATPLVAGVAALLLEENPHLTPARLKQVLLAQATPGVIDLEGAASTANLLVYSLASTSEWTQVDEVTAPYTLDGLEPGGTYEVAIRQTIDGDTSDWSPEAEATLELTLVLPHIASTTALHTPTITTTTPVTIPHIGPTSTLTAPTITTGGVPLTLPTIASAATLHAPTVTTGAVTVTLPHIESTASLAAPTVTAGAGNITLPHIASTTALHGPVVLPAGSGIALPHIDPTATLATPTVTTGPVTVVLPAIGSSDIPHPPTVTTGAVTIVLPTIASAAALYEPTVLTAGAGIALPHITATSTLHTITVTVGPVAITLPRIESVTVIYPPAVGPIGAPSVSRRWHVLADDRTLAPIHDRTITIPATTRVTIGATQ